jgi:hypothetical protein
MSKSKILVQFDTDPQPSVFDSVAAVDAGVERLFRHGGVTAKQVRDLVYGAMFTRGPEDLRRTAIFVGGSNVAAGEAVLKAVTDCFFGPMRVSVMLDSNGANTTAAAAVLTAGRHAALAGGKALVLAATGPVGRRVARLLAAEGANVRIASRDLDRAMEVCHEVAQDFPDATLEAIETSAPETLAAALEGTEIIVAAGAPGVQLLSVEERRKCSTLKVAIDLSAVPPLGLEGIEATDKAVERDGAICYGAIGVGGLKMKIHKAAVAELFKKNDRVLDAPEIYRIGQQLK